MAATTWDPNQNAASNWLNSTYLTATLGILLTTFAIDTSANKYWIYNHGTGKWNDSATADPASGTGGYSPSGLNAGPYHAYGLAQGATTGGTFGLNCGTLNGISMPSGFSTFNSAAGATVTWDASYNTDMTYSEGNLWATRSNGSSSKIMCRTTHGVTGKVCWQIYWFKSPSNYIGLGNSSLANTTYMHDGSNSGLSTIVNWYFSNADSGSKAIGSFNFYSRATLGTEKRSSGKLMFEVVLKFGAPDIAIGVGNSSISLTSSPGQTGSWTYQRTNSVAQTGYNGGSASTGKDAVASGGTPIGIYIDFSVGKLWYYVANGYNRYNSSPTADPSTNTGGIDISAIISTGLFPMVGCGGGSGNFDEVSATANFAGSFTVPVPTGFVAWDLGGFQDILVTSVASAAAFGLPSVLGAATILPVGFGPTGVFGSPLFGIYPSGFGPGAAIGHPTFTQVLRISPQGFSRTRLGLPFIAIIPAKVYAPVPYQMGPPPIGADPAVQRYLNQELRKIEAAHRSLSTWTPQAYDEAPSPPLVGVLYYALAPWDPCGLGGDYWVFYTRGKTWQAL